MNNQELRGHSSEIIRNLKKRLPKCWAWVDQVLSPKYEKETIKKEVVLTLLGKALPDKTQFEGEVKHRITDERFYGISEEELNREETAILTRFKERAGSSVN